MRDFSRRSPEQELMDSDGLSFPEFHHCLQSLETINSMTLAYAPTLRWLRPRLSGGKRLRILDVGSGGGDMLRRIAREAPGQVELIGVDLNPWSARSARLASPHTRVRFATANVFDFEPDKPVDYILSSLFTHHLGDDEVVAFLRWMEGRARRGWFINDLHRHPLPYYVIKGSTRAFSGNRLIRHDAAVSVARAFSRRDWQRLLERANLLGKARLRWHFPFRYCVGRDKPGEQHVH